MAMSVGGGSNVRAEPNVTPMIDVMLVLLIIFMIVVPAINAGFQAIPPHGVNIKSHPEEDEDQVLGIDADGKYYLNKKPIRHDDLGTLLNQIYTARQGDKVLYLKAHNELVYDKVLEAMDVASKNGVRVVAAITDQTPGTASSVAGDIMQMNKAAPAAKAP